MGGAADGVRLSETEFRVRFTQARGLAGLLEKPSNSYHWSGGGTVRVAPSGVLMRGARCQLLGFMQHERRFVPRPQIRQIYREGDAVHMDFHADACRSHLSFWARDSTVAADIVGLLPASCTVELDATKGTQQRGRRDVRRVIVVLALAMLIAAAAAAWLHLRTVTPLTARRPVAVTTIDASSRAKVTTLAPATRTGLEEFADTSDHLQSQFRWALSSLMDETDSRDDFVMQVEVRLLPQWRSLESRLRSAPIRPGTRAAILREHLIAVCLGWQDALVIYVDGLRQEDPDTVMRAFRKIGEAEREDSQAWKLR